jgi:hypothetical protein
VAAGTHRIRIDYQQRGTNPARLRVSAPGAIFKPRYGLLTTATDPDGKVTRHTYLPEAGLETATIADPAGLNLATRGKASRAAYLGTSAYFNLSRSAVAGATTWSTSDWSGFQRAFSAGVGRSCPSYGFGPQFTPGGRC